MPVYEFACSKGHRFERILSFSEFKEEIPCEECKKKKSKTKAKLVPSMTGKPRFMGGGSGGFYSPTT